MSEMNKGRPDGAPNPKNVFADNSDNTANTPKKSRSLFARDLTRSVLGRNAISPREAAIVAKIGQDERQPVRSIKGAPSRIRSWRAQ